MKHRNREARAVPLVRPTISRPLVAAAFVLAAFALLVAGQLR